MTWKLKIREVSNGVSSQRLRVQRAASSRCYQAAQSQRADAAGAGHHPARARTLAEECVDDNKRASVQTMKLTRSDADDEHEDEVNADQIHRGHLLQRHSLTLMRNAIQCLYNKD